MKRTAVRIGTLRVDSVTFDQALDWIAELIERGRGGAVFTPNVDHVIKAETNAAFRDAYERADICLADGMPILWAARLLGSPLPEKVSGSDFVLPLARLAARRRWRVYLLGGAPGVAARAADVLSRDIGVDIVGTASPTVLPDGSCEDGERVLQDIVTARPHLVLAAFGAPKQELWIDRFGRRVAPAVAMGVGGTFDFIIGRTRRAPAWMSRAGLEWLFRLGQEPRRLWRRYLVDDPKFLAVILREMRHSG